jgi:hypothetical protein
LLEAILIELFLLYMVLDLKKTMIFHGFNERKPHVKF